MPTEPIQLDYGCSPPRWRRRRTWITAAILVVVALSVLTTWRHAKQWYHQWVYRREAARWYAQAANWVELPTKLKYTENPIDAPRGKFLRSYSVAGSPNIGFKSFGGSSVERLPLFDASGRLFLAASPDEVMFFMHERTTANDVTRLIAINDPHFAGDYFGVNCNVIGLLNGDYRVLRGGWRRLDMTAICGPGEIRVFAGQPDPKDRSRFSIPFEAHGRRGWIDGVFKPGPGVFNDPAKARSYADENSNIELSIRMESATAPAAR
jgi:hypothetical protein